MHVLHKQFADSEPIFVHVFCGVTLEHRGSVLLKRVVADIDEEGERYNDSASAEEVEQAKKNHSQMLPAIKQLTRRTSLY